MYATDGMLDAEGGSLLRSALDALMGPPERDDGRTTSQRRADALVEMAQRQLDQGELPQRGCQRPHLMLVAQTATLSSEPGEGAPIQVGAGSEILSVGRATRVVPAALRKALMLRDRHCQFPGCPARWADAHHLEHLIEGGKTCLSNLALVCRRCHRAVHEGGWRLVRDAGGVMSVTARAP